MPTPPDPSVLPLLSPGAVERVLRSLLPAELSSAGRRVSGLEGASWPSTLSFGPDGLGLDSLELLGTASAVNRLFHLHETGIEDYLLARASLDGWVEVVRAGLAEGISAASFLTSGSTGTPKACTHKAAILAAEIAEWAALLRGRERVVQLVPAHHVYGFLWTVLLPEALGLPVLDARAMAPGRLARALGPGDLLIGFPGGLLAMLSSMHELPAGLVVTSSTAPLPEATHYALRAQGASRVLEIYGSSETAGIGWREAPQAPFRLLARFRPGQDGDEASVVECATGEAVALPDRVRFEADGRLVLEGRKDQAVQVGGINVRPSLVAERIGSHPLVSACAVRLDTSLAEPRLKAFVVPAEGHAPETVIEPLEAWCRANLPTPERPVRIDAGLALPRNEIGKAADWPA